MTTDAQRIQRLERLAMLKDMLLRHDELFAPESPVSGINGGAISFDLDKWCGLDRCGTAACALGSAALYKPFMEQGLRLSRLPNEKPCLSQENWGAWPTYKDCEGFDAGAKFFGISIKESDFLFCPDAYRSSYDEIYDEGKYFNLLSSVEMVPERKDIEPTDVVKRVDKLMCHYAKNDKPLA